MFNGHKLRKLRQEMGWSLGNVQSQFVALGIPISAQAVHQWETGKSSPNSNHLDVLARILKVRMSDLYDDRLPVIENE